MEGTWWGCWGGGAVGLENTVWFGMFTPRGDFWRKFSPPEIQRDGAEVSIGDEGGKMCFVCPNL
jgi:hypothetical protein